MRKLLALSLVSFLAYACGGAGGGTSSYEGFYKLDGSVEQSGKYAVLKVVRNDDGSVKEAYVPDSSLDVPLKIKLVKSYDGNSEPMRMFVKEVNLFVGNTSFTVPTSNEEITEGGTEVTIYVPTTAKVLLPFLYGNKLEDRVETYAGSYTLAEESDNWIEGEKTVTYAGNSTTISIGKPIKDVSVSFDDVNCPINGSNLEFPCWGSIDFENGSLTAGIDSSYLSTSHSKDVNVETSTYTTILSQKVVPGTVSISGGKLSLTDDGSGNLTGSGGNGTIDYESGQLTLNIDNSTFSYQTTLTSQQVWVSYADNGTFQLPANLKPLSVRLEVTNSTDTGSDDLTIIATCSDDGHGNLIGACSGTINYDNGTLNYDWDDSITNGENVRISYTYATNLRQPLSLTFNWDTEDKNLNLKVSYKELSDKARKVYYFSTPGEVQEVKVFDGSSEVTTGVVTYATSYGSLIKLILSDYPHQQLSVNYISERQFDFNRNVTVNGQESYSFPVDVEVKAELETGKELVKTFHTTVEAFSVEE